MSLIYDGFLLMLGMVLAYVMLQVVGWVIFIAIALMNNSREEN